MKTIKVFLILLFFCLLLNPSFSVNPSKITTKDGFAKNYIDKLSSKVTILFISLLKKMLADN
jgi:hypothetical protein